MGSKSIKQKSIKTLSGIDKDNMTGDDTSQSNIIRYIKRSFLIPQVKARYFMKLIEKMTHIPIHDHMD